MSEQSGGPGWWQASDGKWYPPEQAPTGQQPSVDPTTAQPAYGAPPAAGAPTGGMPAYAAPAAAAGSGGPGKIIAIVVVLALLAGGAAFFLTRSSSSSGSVASFCDTAKKFEDDASLDKAFEDPAQIDRVTSAFDQLTKSAPSEIKNDMNILNDAIKKLASAVKSAGSDPSKAFGAILAASASLDQAKVEQASKNIEKFAKDECGIDFNSSSDDESSSESDSFTFDSSEFESSLSSDFSSFDESSFSSQLSSLCDDFGSEFVSDFCSSS